MGRLGPRATNDPEYRTFKRHLATYATLCWYGCGRRAVSPDHRPRLHEHHHVRGTGCCVLRPACDACNKSDGARYGNETRKAERHSEAW